MSPGLHPDMSNAEYHGAVDWLGSTQLKDYIPEFYSKPTGRDALDFGTALHTTVLGTDERIDVHDFNTWRSKAAEAAREESYAAGAVPILASDQEAIRGMVAALRAHEDASWLLWGAPGVNEVSIFARDHEDRQFKCRPDRLLDNGLIVDLKSTSAKPGQRNLGRAVMDFGYDLSAAHYQQTAQLAGVQATEFAFVFVSKKAPHHVTVANLGDDLIGDGYALRDLAIRRAEAETPAYEGAAGSLTITRPYRRDIPA